MEWVLATVASSDIATALRFSRWLYAAVNTAHILGIALLVGAIVPLDLRLIGIWPRLALEDLVRVLVPVAFCGLALALATGPLLFSVRAPEYAALAIFRVKLALIATGAVSALAIHLSHGFLLKGATRPRRVIAGILSMVCWIGALAAGRMIAFVGD